METSEVIQGIQSSASPSGQLIASITVGKLRLCNAHAPERCTELNTRIQPKDATAIQWNDDSDYIAVCSNRLVEVVDLQNDNHRIRLDNGSGGLGSFATATFIGTDQLLVTWTFGKAKVWNLSTGKSVDLADVKTTCAGDRWQLRPKQNPSTQTLGSLSRIGTEDILHLYLPALQKTVASTKLPTGDAQSLSWSPDGRWLAVLDTPTASSSVHFFTPNGHLFRSYQIPQDASHPGLGIKGIGWAGDSQLVGLTRFDGQIALLNCRTFTPLAMIEHHTVIDQASVSLDDQAMIWQETVPASGERTYTPVSQPFSPPLSRTKATTEPGELGVAEASFSCDGAFLATRDERMLNTVWIWDTASLRAHAVIVQHSNVRRVSWHPSRSHYLLLDCGEAIAYLFDPSSPTNPPMAFSHSLPGNSSLRWLAVQANALPAILCAAKSSFRLLYPDGRPEVNGGGHAADASMVSAEDDDSLLDMLAGRTPLPPQSYTERIDIEVETEEWDSTTRMEDTFRGKQVFDGRREDPGGDGERDPFDDSQIF